MMRKAIVICFLFILFSGTASAVAEHSGFNTLSIGAGYRYSHIFDDVDVSHHGPGIALSNMNSIGTGGLYIYEDLLAGFPLSLHYGDEVRYRSDFRSLVSFDASFGAGWSGLEGIIRYFLGGGICVDLLSYEVRCGSLLDISIGVECTAGVNVILDDLLFIECSAKISYMFLDFENTRLSGGNEWASSLINGVGITGKLAIGIDLG